MTWLYVPGTFSASALASADWNSASELPSPERAASLTWRGKPQQPQAWSRAWRRGGFIRLLSGLTLEPSTLDRGVASFIASLREIPASPTASPESDREPTTIAGSSTSSSASSRNAGLIVSSERTCRGTPTGSSPPSSRHWSDWATALRAEYSARPRPAPVIAESGSSSWLTARAEDSESAGRRHGRDVSDTLTAMSRDFAAMWPTPMAGTPAQNGNNAAGNSDFSRRTMELAGQWRTPMTADDGRKVTAVGNQVQLMNQVLTWPTPAAGNFNDGESLESFDARKARQKAKGINGNGMGDSLAIAASRLVEISPPSPQAQATPAGPTSSPERRSLNPLFVEWLMGWPTGLSGFERAETELFRWLLQMRGCLSALRSRPIEQQGRLL